MLLRPATPELQARLVPLTQLSPEHGWQLSSHLPMALSALDAMGATPSQLDRFSAQLRAAEGLQPQASLADASQPGRGVLSDWPALLGNFDSHAQLRSSLAQALRQQGREALLAHALPRLLQAPGAVAFHGLIRAAHALESGVEPELVEALAYWGARWLPLPLAQEAAGPDRAANAQTWFDRLDAALREATPPWQSDAPLISQRMQSAAHTPAWRRWAQGLARPADAQALLADLAHAAAQRYLRSGNFTVLHMVTGLRAAAVLHAETMPLDHSAVGRLLDAVAAASMASRLASMSSASALEPGLDEVPPNWPALLTLACEASNDHVVKLVHALAWWQDRHADPLWGRAAQRALGLAA